jgi:internalin A
MVLLPLWSRAGGRKSMSNDTTGMRCYVSYAWADESNPDREAQVDALVEQARKKGIDIVRDKDVLKAGDSISDFMRRIGGGDRVFVFLSRKYLTSPFCMNELFLIWRNSREDENDFLGRVRAYKLDDVSFDTFEDRLYYGKYWRKEHDRLEGLIKDSLSEVSQFDYKRFRLMDQFATNIGDILALFSDTVRARNFEDFLKYGFEDTSPTGREPPPPAPPPPRTEPSAEKGAVDSPRPLAVSQPSPKMAEARESTPPTPSVGQAGSKWPMALAALAALALAGVGAGYLAVKKPAPVDPTPGPGSLTPQPSADEAWCYQEHQKTGLYFVACHKLQANCAKARGDNNPLPGTGCELVDLSKARWSPAEGGLLGSQYQTASAPFPKPFPQIAESEPSSVNTTVITAEYSVYIQFAGYERPQIVSLADALVKQHWNVQGRDQGGERTASAAGLSEVRYHDAQRKAAADILAGAINATGLLNTQVRAVAVAAVQPNVLEVWIGQR